MSSGPAPRFKVLVVDDVPEICATFEAILKRVRRIEIETVVETNAADAAARVQRERFDLVVSDFRMREANGLEILSAARKTNPDGRRVLLTAYNELPARAEKLRDAQLDAYVQKPVKAQDLIFMVEDLLTGSEDVRTAYRNVVTDLERRVLVNEPAQRVDA